MQLDALQAFLARAFQQAEPLTASEEMRAALADIICKNERLTPAERADIYREQFWLRHRDVLYQDYPALSWYLGDEAFEAFARAYLEACPPDSYTLRDLGNRIASFAERYDGFASDRAGPARDLARFELAFIDVFDGPDASPVSLAAAQAVAPEAWPTARIDLHPCLKIVALDHPVQTIRTAVKRHAESDGEEPSRELEAKPTFVALWRGDDLKVHYRPIAAGEARLLEALRGGQHLGAAIALEPVEAADLHGWFKGWATRGWIVGICPEAP